MADELLSISDLHVIYETDDDVFYAVNGVDLSIKRGEVLGLVGETGAGKTTIAISVLRLLPSKIGSICGGKIVYDGVEIHNANEERMQKIRGNKISMIFQDPMTSLNPSMKVGDQIAEVIQVHYRDLGSAEVEAKVDEMLQLVGIMPERKVDYPHQFSGGMKQRVVIAIALACQPDLLIADEPTTALDVTIQAQVLDMMGELRRKFNTAVILISHDLGVIAKMCDTVAIMYAGEIIEYGTAEDIYTGENHHPYTTGLFGSIPDLNSVTDRLKPIDGLMPDPSDLPSGCKFHPRCEKCMEICKIEVPDSYQLGTHRIKCHLYSGGSHE